MSEAKVGEEFVKHEFDEAIAIQQCIVATTQTLAQSHPELAAKAALQASLQDDERFLTDLRRLGSQHGAIGVVEDVAGGLKELMEATLAKATGDGADSDVYEAHAVLVNLKRKQSDSAGGMLEIARATGDRALEEAATEFQMVQVSTAQTLANALAAYAGRIATQ